MVKGAIVKKIFVILILFAGVVFASRAVSYESLTVTDSAKAITPSTLSLVLAHGQCSGRLETAQIRFRVDGTDPTDSEGVLVEVGEFITIRELTNLLAFRAIRTGESSGVLKLHCYQ